MCGITGFIEAGTGRGVQELAATLDTMTDTLAYRGPDDRGTWVDTDRRVALGHRRLSILDLSAAGHQPMISASGRYRIVYNGEVYNHADLHRTLVERGCTFQGHSDTEVILAAFETWGVAQTLLRLVGMFAFAVWDAKEQRMLLGRDRLGEKPLYYGWIAGNFLFGSELKALRAHPVWRGDIRRDALRLYLRHSYIPAPHSIYDGIYKLPPGSLLEVVPGPRPTDFSPFADTHRSGPRSYWSLEQVVAARSGQCFGGSPTEAVDSLDALLRNSIRRQMVADVPVGALLSGGVDSSTVVALMQAESRGPVHTFTIGYAEQEYNEAEYARAIAQHLGTEHTELVVTPGEAQAVIPQLPSIYDEPFADASQIPTYLVSRLARSQVTVSLSGDGGDELFCGYPRYFWGNRIWNKLGKLPRPLRTSIKSAINVLPTAAWDSLWRVAAPLLRSKTSNFGEKLNRVATMMMLDTRQAMYRLLVSHWAGATSPVLGNDEPPTLYGRSEECGRFDNFLEMMMYIDALTYLPDDILVKVDRAAMAVSLETRVPMLDHSVVEFAWSLPISLRFKNGQGKWPLRQVLYRYVPKEMIERPKMGFSVPIDQWLRGPLRDWAEDLLAEDRIKREGFFRPELIRRRWAQHLSGGYDWQYHLWDILMFQSWLENVPQH